MAVDKMAFVFASTALVAFLALAVVAWRAQCSTNHRWSALIRIGAVIIVAAGP